ncbi:glutaredoxin 2 [Vibrio porteresiae]|uniref:Glutaredoxin 2 n=1 Tax=Vibrio porteresiae DSM 19223 TaxID=1123496 RepID=A0ABZ0Q9V5_9VIBR|nr:glutaredoxin 2 [Vibrio porteresiae]WPC73196.1 glutaredoxin 2 [Vibrio porteresiae DSM 19223]
MNIPTAYGIMPRYSLKNGISMLTLYIYEHCPFCARVRYIAGLLHIPVEEKVLAYDDLATPTALIGKKAVPILVKADGSAMGESLDIIHYLLGLKLADVAPQMVSEAVANWQSQAFPLLQKVGYPRWHQLGLGEFLTLNSRQLWQKNKETEELNFERLIAEKEAIAAQVTEHIAAVEALLFPEHGVTSLLDEAVIYSLLRGWICLPEIEWPERVMTWLRRRSVATGVSVMMAD